MKTLLKALADFQQEVPVIHKGTSGFNYSYADLPAIFEVINPLLKKHKLGFTQPIMGDTIKTIIFHTESGEMLESLTDIPKNVQLAKMNEFQVLGSAITYIRRYALSSILGLVTDKDTDASGEQLKTTVKTELKPILQEGGLAYLLSAKSTKDDLQKAINERQLTNEQRNQILEKLKTK